MACLIAAALLLRCLMSQYRVPPHAVGTLAVADVTLFEKGHSDSNAAAASGCCQIRLTPRPHQWAAQTTQLQGHCRLDTRAKLVQTQQVNASSRCSLSATQGQ